LFSCLCIDQTIAEANGATGATLRETVSLEGMPLAA
jgi:hypothetical protein